MELLHDKRQRGQGGVVFDFAETREGENAREFLRTGANDKVWRGTLVCDDYAGYKAMFEQGVREAGCLAHARRKFHELWDPHRERQLKALL